MKIAIIAAWIIATAALAGPQAVWKDGTTRTYWPSRIAWPDGRETLGANASQCAEAGVARHETKQEQDKREQAAAAAAKAQAAQAASFQAALDAQKAKEAGMANAVQAAKDEKEWREAVTKWIETQSKKTGVEP